MALTARYWRYYGYAFGMLSGLLLGLLGCVAKVQLSHNRAGTSLASLSDLRFSRLPYISACISTLQRQPEAFKLKSISPRIFSVLFILGDFMCLCFIGAIVFARC